MGLINTGIMENKIHASFKSIYYSVFKFGCYNSLDNSRCERVMKMGCVLMETSKIAELDNNIRNNGADPWQ